MILTGLAVVAYLLLSSGSARADGRRPGSPLAAVTGSGHPVQAVVHTAGKAVRTAGKPVRTAGKPVHIAAKPVHIGGTPVREAKPVREATDTVRKAEPARAATGTVRRAVRTADSSTHRASAHRAKPVRTTTGTVRRTVRATGVTVRKTVGATVRRSAPVVRERTVRSVVRHHDGELVAKVRRSAPLRSTVDRLAEKRMMVKPVVERVVKPVTERVVQPVTERVVQPVAERVVRPAAERVVQPVTERVVRPAAEAVVQPAVHVVLQPVAATVVSTAARPLPVPVLHTAAVGTPLAVAVVRPAAAHATRASHPPTFATAPPPVLPGLRTTAAAADQRPPTCEANGAAGPRHYRSEPRSDRAQEPGRLPAPPYGPGTPAPAMSPVSATGGPQGSSGGWATTSSAWRPALRPADVLIRAARSGHGRRLTLALPPG